MALIDFKLDDVGKVFKDIRAAVTGKEILNPEAELELFMKMKEAEATMIEMQSRVIIAEASSAHSITSVWRPITMLVFVFIIANNYIFVPYISALFSVNVPALELTQNMWDLLKLGIGGYIAGRSIEQSVKAWKDKK